MAFAPKTWIKVARVAGGANAANPTMRRLGEDASETGLRGAPVIQKAGDATTYEESGAIADATGVLLAGFASENFHDLTTKNTAKHLSAGTPPNQPSATIIPQGAPLSDGKIGVNEAAAENVFEGCLGTTDAATAPAAADIGKIYGLTKDTGFWFVDKAKTTVLTGAIVTVVALHPQDEIKAGGLEAGDRVLFVVNQANRLFEQ